MRTVQRQSTANLIQHSRGNRSRSTRERISRNGFTSLSFESSPYHSQTKQFPPESIDCRSSTRQRCTEVRKSESNLAEKCADRSFYRTPKKVFFDDHLIFQFSTINEDDNAEDHQASMHSQSNVEFHITLGCSPSSFRFMPFFHRSISPLVGLVCAVLRWSVVHEICDAYRLVQNTPMACANTRFLLARTDSHRCLSFSQNHIFLQVRTVISHKLDNGQMASNTTPAVDKPEITTELAETSASVQQASRLAHAFCLFIFLEISNRIRMKSTSRMKN